MAHEDIEGTATAPTAETAEADAPPVGLLVSVAYDEESDQPTITGVTPLGSVRISEYQYILEQGIKLYRQQLSL